MHALVAAVALALAPVHGVVLATTPTGDAIVRIDAVPDVAPETTRRFHLVPNVRVPGGTQIDAYLDRSTQPWTLRSAAVAGPFAPGEPDPAHVIPIELGSTLPADRIGRCKTERSCASIALSPARRRS